MLHIGNIKAHTKDDTIHCLHAILLREWQEPSTWGVSCSFRLCFYIQMLCRVSRSTDCVVLVIKKVPECTSEKYNQYITSPSVLKSLSHVRFEEVLSADRQSCY